MFCREQRDTTKDAPNAIEVREEKAGEDNSRLVSFNSSRNGRSHSLTEISERDIDDEKPDDNHSSADIGQVSASFEKSINASWCCQLGSWMSTIMLTKLLFLDPNTLRSCRKTLRSAVEMGAILLWYYVADRTTAIASSPKHYVRDVFLFIFLVLTLVAGSYSKKEVRSPVFANRQQTEEWKGWMQVLFLLYHYYEAKEAYNAIRVFIASYVWMTGFGNFSYYYKSKDFSLGRFCQMLWRLNLLAVLCCVVLDNQYMLYYICPMHTLYTIMVYATLAFWKKGNETSVGIWIKIVCCFVVVMVVWEIKPIFYAIFRPLSFLLSYSDPRRPNPDVLHEWYFRTGLDRYVWIHGMICAFMHRRLEAMLQRLDSDAHQRRQTIVRIVLAFGCGAAFVLWYRYVFRLPKLQYNILHPYTSWIPISAYLVLRNLTPPLRQHTLGLYGWLGCITLETCKFLQFYFCSHGSNL